MTVLDDAQLLRYSRHILLDDLGIEGQERLLAAHALVIGAGGLGSPAALYLGSAGVGRITLVDHDTVDTTNLQRQIAHTSDRVGTAKAESARVAITAINTDPQVTSLVQRADASLLNQLLPTVDIVLDCTDNFSTRHIINRVCVNHRKPLVSGSAIRMDGQLSVYDQHDPVSPCYACVFPEEDGAQEVHCATMGVFAPLVGIVGTLQAAEAIKLLVGVGSRLIGQLLMIDGRDMAFNRIRLLRNPHCRVCGENRS